MIDFSWLFFIGTYILGYSSKEVGHFTYGKIMKLYQFYQDYYDFTLSRMSYKELNDKYNESEEWIPD